MYLSAAFSSRQFDVEPARFLSITAQVQKALNRRRIAFESE